MSILAMLYPFIFAKLNRTWRGEGGAPKWAWFTFMVLAAGALTLDPYFMFIWLLFLLGYAVPPTNALFCSVTGRPPGRKDKERWQWMQDVALEINQALPAVRLPEFWYRYSVVYGAVRAWFMCVAVIMMYGYLKQEVVLLGLLCLAHGRVYTCGRRLSLRTPDGLRSAVKIAEYICGAFIGLYLLLLGAVHV